MLLGISRGKATRILGRVLLISLNRPCSRAYEELYVSNYLNQIQIEFVVSFWLSKDNKFLKSFCFGLLIIFSID